MERLSFMSVMRSISRPHALVFPIPLQGHINPMLMLANKLVSAGIDVTFLHSKISTQLILDTDKHSVVDGNTTPINSHPQFNIEFIHISSQDEQLPITSAIMNFLNSTMDVKPNLEKIVKRLMDHGHPATCIISDSFVPWTQDVANKFGIPRIEFWSSSATVYSMGYHIPQLIRKGYLPIQPGVDDDFSIDIIPELASFRLADFFYDLDANAVSSPVFHLICEAFSRAKEAEMVLVNTFYHLEKEIINAMQAEGIQMEAVGPLSEAWSQCHTSDAYSGCPSFLNCNRHDYMDKNCCVNAHSHCYIQMMSSCCDNTGNHCSTQSPLPAARSVDHAEYHCVEDYEFDKQIQTRADHLSSNNHENQPKVKHSCIAMSKDPCVQDDESTGQISHFFGSLNSGDNEDHSKLKHNGMFLTNSRVQDNELSSLFGNNAHDSISGNNHEEHTKLKPNCMKLLDPFADDKSNHKHKDQPKFKSCVVQKGSFSNDDQGCMTWLDKQKPSSVVYISFGSMVTLSTNELHELALGLEDSKVPFLLVVRPGMVRETSESESLPEGFVERTKERGKICAWAPQIAVLKHPAILGFLTHCGWNSAMEGMSAGVPLIGCPRESEQHTNLKCLREWKIAIALDPISKGKARIRRAFVKDAIAKLVQEESTGMVRLWGTNGPLNDSTSRNSSCLQKVLQIIRNPFLIPASSTWVQTQTSSSSCCSSDAPSFSQNLIRIPKIV